MPTKKLETTLLRVHFILVSLAFDVDLKHYGRVDCEVPYFHVTDVLPSEIAVRLGCSQPLGNTL